MVSSFVCGLDFQRKDNSCPEAVHALRLDRLRLASNVQSQKMAVDALHCWNGEKYNTIQYSTTNLMSFLHRPTLNPGTRKEATQRGSSRASQLLLVGLCWSSFTVSSFSE